MEKFTKNDMDDFRTKKIGVNCKTKELAIEFLSLLDEDGWYWLSQSSKRDKLSNFHSFYCYGEREVYHAYNNRIAHFQLNAYSHNHEYTIKSFEGWDETVEKPPLGVMPKYIFEEKRIMDLCRALYEYSQYKIDKDTVKSMTDWTIELCERLNNLDK